MRGPQQCDVASATTTQAGMIITTFDGSITSIRTQLAIEVLNRAIAIFESLFSIRTIPIVRYSTKGRTVGRWQEFAERSRLSITERIINALQPTQDK